MRYLLSLGVALLALCCASAALSVKAQALPAAYVGFDEGAIRWVGPKDLNTWEHLRKDAALHWRALCEDLGLDVELSVEIRIARNQREMRELAPREMLAGSPLGVAYSDLGIAVVALVASDGTGLVDAEEVLVHELSHLALYRAVGGKSLPRWFSEGLAVVQAKEFRVSRFTTMLRGAVSKNLIPLAELSYHFPKERHKVNIAYAQSADLVAFMREARGLDRFQAFIAALGRDDDFESALVRVYGWTYADLEVLWRDSFRLRYRLAPLVFGGGTLWVLTSFLVIWAWRKRRSEQRAKLDAMAADEAFDTWVQEEALQEQEEPTVH